MMVLGFEREAEIANRKRVRRGVFERRSSLPVTAACVVANGVRETLCALLATPVSLRLLEPVIPDPQAWNAIGAGALLFSVRGPVADGAFVLRPRDALALAAAAFAEAPGDERDLSPLENEVVTRALRAIAGSLAPICGREISTVERILDIRGYATYFELLVERPIALRLGIALSHDPSPRGAGTLRIDDLLDVQIEVAVEFARGNMDGAAFLDLRPGANVPMMTRMGEPGSLKAGGITLARGECGALGERSAVVINAKGLE